MKKRKVSIARAYEADLAYVHDAGFTSYVRDAVPGLFETLSKNGIKDGVVIDLGCGSGVWARELTDHGYDALGIDISEAMLRLARKRAPKAKFLKASFLESELPPCNAVTAIGEPVNYLFDPRNSSSQLLSFFKRVHRALQPGGVFIFDVAGPGRTGQAGPVLRHSEGDNWAILMRTEEDARSRILTRQMTVFRRIGTTYRRSRETHMLKLYTRAQVEQQLRKAGFRVRVRRGYGHSMPRPGLLVFTARKA